MKTTRFSYQRADAWPPLAWLARCRPGSAVVEVVHGARVEAAPDWFCEGVWDGPYDSGDFDRTDLIFGSGGHARRGGVTFVSPGSTVDRLQALEIGGDVWVSNSLPCLLAASHGRVDPAYPHYFRDFSSIRLGLSRYIPQLATSAGSVRLIYFHNVTWDGNRLQVAEKPFPVRDFDTFERYRGFLETALRRVGENLEASARRHPLRLLGTISSGYDSPTVATLARPAGLREVISFEHSGDADSDSGRDIAAHLGLAVMVIARDAWRAAPLAEVPFLAADAKGEDVFFRSAEASLTGRVLLTGFHGDKVWGKDTTALGPDLVRGDQSGLSLTEYRLRTGFLHCPVPFMGVRQIRDINRLSRSPGLAPWDVGGSYTRPICRRIVEEAGVARGSFGVSKKAASVLFFQAASFLTPAALGEYLQWLDAHVEARVQPDGWGKALRKGVTRTAEAIGTVALLSRGARRLAAWADREPLFRWVFPWALDQSLAAYPPIDAPPD